MERIDLEPITNPAVARVFAEYPENLKARLLALRKLILETAAEIDGVGPLEETLKWGQPSYLTTATKSGTTIRIDQIKSKPDQQSKYGMFVHCQTTLVSGYRELYSGVLGFDGNRGLTFDSNEDPPEDVLRHCIELALTYHSSKGGNA